MKNLLATLLLATVTAFPAAPTHAADAPNILLILVDDMGYSDPGFMGSNISTPNLDRLASGGVLFTHAYNGARCMPTRASLMTGVYPHQAGMGYMAEPLTDDAYRGHIHHNVVTIAEVLKAGGYATMFSGKWHAAHETRDPEHSPENRGFERTAGHNPRKSQFDRVDHFDPAAFHVDGKPAPQPVEGFYLANAETDFAMQFMGEALDSKPKRPFFCYLAYNAPHWPIQAQEHMIQPYLGKFMEGWDVLRERRFEEMKKRGIIPANSVLPPRDPAIPAWDSLSEEEKRDWDRKMAVYAAMLTAVDDNIGRIIAMLKERGAYDNTLILFLSDNGGSAESIGLRTKRRNPPIGAPGSFFGVNMPWANLNSAPFRFFKHWAHEGGIATPLVAHWPDGITNPGRLSTRPTHLIDIMATAVDVSGATYPETFNGHDIKPMEGLSLRGELDGTGSKTHDILAWEHGGSHAVRQGDWKLVRRDPGDTRHYESWGFPTNDQGGEWELYNLAEDRTEMNNLAAKMPGKVAELETLYNAWAERVGVEPWDSLEKKSKKRADKKK